MSIATDLKARADELTETVQTSLTGAVNDLRTQAEKTARPYVERVNETARPYVEQVTKTARPYVEQVTKTARPYVEQAKGYADTAKTRAEELINTVTGDKRIAKVVDAAQTLSGTVTETVQVRVVTPVRNLTGTSRKPAVSKPATKPATAKPATKATAKPATKATAKPATKAARKSPARKAPAASAE